MRPDLDQTATYVVDAHALYWYWTRPTRLSAGSTSAFSRIEAGQAFGLVPAIAAMEIVFLTAKTFDPRPIESVLAQIDRSPALRLASLTRQYLIASGRLTDIPEMHDRLIAAVAQVHDATLITRDETLRTHPLLRTVW